MGSGQVGVRADSENTAAVAALSNRAQLDGNTAEIDARYSIRREWIRVTGCNIKCLIGNDAVDAHAEPARLWGTKLRFIVQLARRESAYSYRNRSVEGAADIGGIGDGDAARAF